MRTDTAQCQKTTGTADSVSIELGRLSELGVSGRWQVALLLPDSYTDLVAVTGDARAFELDKVVTVRGTINTAPERSLQCKGGHHARRC